MIARSLTVGTAGSPKEAVGQSPMPTKHLLLPKILRALAKPFGERPARTFFAYTLTQLSQAPLASLWFSTALRCRTAHCAPGEVEEIFFTVFTELRRKLGGWDIHT